MATSMHVYQVRRHFSVTLVFGLLILISVVFAACSGSDEADNPTVGPTATTATESDRSVDLTIPMLPEMELAAIKTAEGVAHFMGLTENKLEEVKMALIEACINAFEHSQSKDPHVTINFTFDDDALTIQISDTGQGFDPSEARKEVVQRRERGESRRGWGLKIMEELMDKVDIHSNENGTEITMVKKR